MAKDIVIWERDLPRFKGKWSWTGQDLRKSISTYKPDYRYEDPRTWPRIDEEGLRIATGRSYVNLDSLPGGFSSPPMGIAYEGSLIANHLPPPLRNKSNMYDPGKPNSKLLNRRFYSHPFVFGANGEYRKERGMTREELRIWIESFTGNPANVPGIGISAPPILTRNEPISPDKAYSKAMKVLEGNNTASLMSRIQDLDENVAELQKKVVQQTSRALAAEDRAVKLKSDHATEQARKNAHISATEDKVKTLETRLAASGKALSVANERIINMSAAIMKCHTPSDVSVVSKKRKAVDEDAGEADQHDSKRGLPGS